MSTSVERSLSILRAVAGGDGPTHGELAEQLGAPKGTVSKLLTQLRELGYVELDGRRHLPGPALLSLTREVRRDEPLQARVRPVLERLVQRTGESAMLTVEIGGAGTRAGSVLVVDHVESPSPVRYVAPIGEPAPIWRTAAGRVLLAFSGRGSASVALPARIDPVEYDTGLAEIRRRGYALVHAEHAATVAAPVLDASGHPLGAISVVGLAERMADPQETIWPELRDALDGLRVA